MKTRKPKISAGQARILASEYIAKQELRGWRFEIAEVTRFSGDLKNWNIIVDRFSPEGGLVDGPEILIIDGTTGDVSTLESYYQ